VTLPPPSILPPPSPERQLVVTLSPTTWAAQLAMPFAGLLFFTATGAMPWWVLGTFVVLLPVGIITRAEGTSIMMRHDGTTFAEKKVEL
jgi:hypothetical protein